MNFQETVERYKEIKKLRRKKISLDKIGAKFGVSKQRIQQIIEKGYPVERIKKISKYIGFVPEYSEYINKLRGRERTREIARMRDAWTCQDCKKVWIKGQRRFDIHHTHGLCGKRSRKYDRVKDLHTLLTLCHKCHFNRPEHRVKTKKFSRAISKAWKLKTIGK